MIGQYCREYRLKQGWKLKDIVNSDQIKTLSAFEMGRSSNIKHLIGYIELSKRNNDLNTFITGLIIKLSEK